MFFKLVALRNDIVYCEPLVNETISLKIAYFAPSFNFLSL
jgi:hypothetical protein